MDHPQTFVKHFPSDRRQMLHTLKQIFSASNDSSCDGITLLFQKKYWCLPNKLNKKIIV